MTFCIVRQDRLLEKQFIKTQYRHLTLCYSQRYYGNISQIDAPLKQC